MTEQEIANAMFADRGGSTTSQSLLSGLALGDSANGKVLVAIDGARIGGGSDDEGVLLDTTCTVSSGQRVVISAYGPEGNGKKVFVSGVVGGGSGGGDISALETRVSTLEDKETEDRTKINEIITAVNNLKWYRVYYFTVSGTNHGASLWYQPGTGFVYCSFEINGLFSTGWNYYNSTAIPSDLRPSNTPYNPKLHDARNVIWSTPRILLCSGSDGKLSVNLESGGTSNEAGSILYLCKPGLSYSSSYWVGPDITQLSLTRALAARVVLGDGLDIQQDELENTPGLVDALDDAYDVIFGQDPTSGDER